MTIQDPELLAMLRAAFPGCEDARLLRALNNESWSRAAEYHCAQVAAARDAEWNAAMDAAREYLRSVVADWRADTFHADISPTRVDRWAEQILTLKRSPAP
jgi:hypothetical protein